MSTRKPSSIATKIVATFAIAALSLSAQATRYWRGTESTALFSGAANWSESSSGSTGATAPDASTGDTAYRLSTAGINKTVFDGAYTVSANVYIETQTPRNSPFVWSATDPSYGLAMTADGWKFGRYADRTPAWLRIDSGTYSAPYLRLGVTADEEVGLILKGGSVSADIVRMAEADSINATLRIDGGSFTSKTEIAYKSMANATNIIEVNGGTVSLAKFLLGGRSAKTAYDVANCYNRLEVNGGTIEWTGESGIGYAKGENSFAEMIVNDGATVNCGYGYFYVGDSGPGALTINGGTFTMADSENGGLTLGHAKSGKDIGTLTLNGGVLTTKRLRLDYVQAGSKAVFNGGTLKATSTATDFIKVNANLTCEIRSGGLVIDTAGCDVTIAHEFVDENGGTENLGTITKKGLGTLTLSAAFPAEKIIVQKGTVSANGTTYVPQNETSAQSRYWLGATQDALVSQTANWAAESGGEGGASSIDDDYLGKVYFDGVCTGGETVFDSPVDLANTLYVGAAAETPLVWSATDDADGLALPSDDWLLGYDATRPTADLRIDGGTYSCNYMRIGNVADADVEVVLNGGSVTTANGRVGGGNDRVSGTLAISNGTFTATGTLLVLPGAKTGGTALLEVNGGTLVTTGPDFVRIGDSGTASTGVLHMVSGTWNTKSFLVGGSAKKGSGNPVSYTGLDAKIVVDGGTVNVSGDSSIGANIGADSRSEMIVNGGDVNINANCLYVGEGGPGYLTVNGGNLTMKDSDYGVSLGHLSKDGTGSDPAFVTLNGGVLATPKLRLDYIADGSKIVFNGGTLKATRDQTSYLDDASGLVCEIAEGGLIFDTNGHDVTIAHDLTGVGGIVKRGLGTLTLSGNNSFQGEIVIEEGDVVDGERFDIDGLAYTTVLDVESDGQDLGTVQLHRSPLSAWLANTDFETYSSVYGSKGTESRETPRYIAVAANGVTNTYMNLNTASNVTGTVGGLAYSFTTEDVAPRTLRIDTPASPGFVYNVRDVGSWPLESTSGKRMNQDVILRGGHLDGFVDATADQRSASYLTSIGLKTEIDLRIVGLDNEMPDGYKNLDPDGADGSFAADNCSYYRFGLGWGSESGTQIGADADGNFTNQVRKTFSTLGSEGRLPAYFHCRIGTDRTGITGLLLLGLMGVEEEVLYRDYLMSNFANIGGSRSSEVPETFLRYILRGNCNGGKYVYDTKDAQYGVSVASRCRQYLQMCGVTDEEIGRITQALSGETPAEVLARVDAYEAANNFRTVSYVPYEGSSTTNAIHRFGTNGERILPRDTPTRDGYTFKGWDVENEQDTGNGTAVVYAKWESNAAADPLSLKWDNNAGDFRIANGGNWYIDKSDPRDYRTPRIIDDCTFEGNATVTLGMDEEFFAKSLYFGNWGSPATITVTNGTFEVANDVTIGHYGANAAFNIYDGEVTVKRFIVGNWGSHDNNTLNVYGGNVVLTGEGSPWPGTLVLGLQTESRGDMLVKGGTVTVNGGAKVGFSNLLNIGGPSADYNSSITIDGGSLAVSGTIDVADSDSGSGGGGGRVYVKSGSLSTTGDLNISASADSWGQVDITGGKATVGGTIRVGNNASAQHAVLNVAGGELDANEISVARQCDGTLYITDGGVVSANQIQKAQGAPAAASPKIVIDGGTIVAKKDTGLFFASVDSVTIGEGGAAFDTAGYNVTIEACRGISGIGSFTKKGLGTLEVKADSYGIHCDWKVRGRIVVEAGTLKLPANQTIYCEGTQVAEGAALNLNGSTIVVVTKKVVESLWTNATGDGSASNPSNWRSTIKYFDENGAEVTAIEESLDGVLPTADTDVKVPLDCTHPDVSGMTVKSVVLYGSSDSAQILRGNVAVPDVVKTAVAWYDPDDVATVTVNDGGKVIGMKNKGTGGSDLDLVPYNENSLPSYGAPDRIASRLVLSHSDDEFGLMSGELYDFGSEGFTMFSVLERHAGGAEQVFGIEVQSGENYDVRGVVGIAQWPGWSNGRLMVDAVTNDAPGFLVMSDLQNTQDRAYIWCLAADGTSASGFGAYTGGDGNMAMVTSAGLVYDSLGVCTRNEGRRRVYLGMRGENLCGSSGFVGESMIFNRRLTDEEIAAVREYLYVKWTTPADVDNIPSDVLLEDGATLDFGGGTWTFDTVKGSGTIGTANIVVEGSIEPGLVVEGSVTFAEGATIDISRFDRSAPGGEVVFLTADSIENWPRKVRSSRRLSALRLVENQDGTVSLVGKVAAIGLGIRLR